MRKGILYTDIKLPGNNPCARVRRSNIEFSNSRGNPTLEKFEQLERGTCGDHPVTVNKTSCDSCKNYRKLESCSQVKDCKSVYEEFLLPPKKRNSKAHASAKKPVSEVGAFPFKSTPSGNLKVKSDQVLFESRQLSVLVANPKQAEVQIYSATSSMTSGVPKISGQSGRFPTQDELSRNIERFSRAPDRDGPHVEPEEYSNKPTNNILDPELSLTRMGYNLAGVDLTGRPYPQKTDMATLLTDRICRKINTDCKVVVGNEEFNCHLILLQVYSELFAGYVAIKKVEIPVEKCSADTFRFIYEWLLGNVDASKYLKSCNILDVLIAANFLKIKDLSELCWAFLDDPNIFTEHNAFYLYVEAREKNIEEIPEMMITRIRRFFLPLVSSQDWLNLKPEYVTVILKSNYIVVSSEMEIFMAGVRWLRHDWTNRREHMLDVIKCVRFGNCAPWQLIDIKRNPENPEFVELAQDPAICKLIDDGLAYVIIKYWYGDENDDFGHWNAVLGLNEPAPRSWDGEDKIFFTYREFLISLDQIRRIQPLDNEQIHPDCPSTSGILLTGEHSFSKQNIELEEEVEGVKNVHFESSESSSESASQSSNDLTEREETVNTGLLFTSVENAKAQTYLNRLSTTALSPKEKNLLVKNSLFDACKEIILIFGGVDPNVKLDKNKNTGQFILRYRPTKNKWDKVGALPEPRHYHSVAFMKGRVYLAGGIDPRIDDIRGVPRVVDSVWSFDPAERVWFSEASLWVKRRSFGLVACKQKLYAIGGCNEICSLKSVECFDPERSTWKKMAPMRTCRAGPACTKYRDSIWAVGGSCDLKTNSFDEVAECYSIKFNQWCNIRRLNSPRCFSHLISMSDHLYLIGGMTLGPEGAQTQSITSLGTVEIFDPHALKWENFMQLSIPRHGHAVAYIGTQIFVMGGCTTIYSRCLTNTECFCSSRGEYSFVRFSSKETIERDRGLS